MRSLLVIVTLAAGACTTADKPPAAETATQVVPSSQPAAPDPAPRPVIAGGYGTSNQAEPGVAAAQTLAVAEIYKREPQRGIVENVTSETQVVAGLNYRFVIKMTGVNSYRVVVFKPLQGEMQVTSFEKLTPAQ